MIVLLACVAPLTDAEAALGNIGKGAALERYAEIAAASTQLETVLSAACADPALLADAQSAWKLARVPWKQTEIFKFGPVIDEPLRYGPKIDDWPTNTEALDTLLLGDDDYTTIGDEVGSTTRGFPALEYLLFADPDAFVATRRCELAGALATDLVSTTTGLWTAWSPTGGNYLGNLVLPEDDSGGFMSKSEVVAELVNRAAFTVEDIRNDKLGKPSGLTSGGTPNPEDVESPYSGHSLADARASLVGVGQVLDGLMVLVPERRADLRLSIPAAVEDAQAALTAIPEPLSESMLSHPGAIETAMARLQDLQVLLQADLTEVLGVTVQFNDNDGD